MRHTINIPYGDSEERLEVDDRNLSFSVEPRVPPRSSVREERDKVEQAISNPIGTPSLDELVRPQSEGAILVDDFTRPTPAYRVMPVVLETLAKIGVADDKIKIIIARGTHRRLSRADMEQKVGKEVVERFQVKNHENDTNTSFSVGALLRRSSSPRVRGGKRRIETKCVPGNNRSLGFDTGFDTRSATQPKSLLRRIE